MEARHLCPKCQNFLLRLLKRGMRPALLGPIWVIDMNAENPSADVAHRLEGDTAWAAGYPEDWNDSFGRGWYYPTHWMPLPKAPASPSVKEHGNVE